ncbi:hypothetical protein TNCV_1501181 [Trichonephila clavipes]|uniref:Uncharacterized protein n=1 Tax=Trichonephila clavipes TaxID=2585209 RepID=A0A8X6RQ77_TRICX|nr:hypothetical protein TNCV_1501181 [Trichonephila clavipes]
MRPIGNSPRVASKRDAGEQSVQVQSDYLTVLRWSPTNRLPVRWTVVAYVGTPVVLRPRIMGTAVATPLTRICDDNAGHTAISITPY